MTRRGYLRIGFGGLAVGIALAATAVWWFDGAWENAAMPNHGLAITLVIAACGTMCLLAAFWVEREKRMAVRQTLHEDLERSRDVETGSDRSFGVIFAVVFAAIGLFPLVKGAPVHWWAVILGGAFLLVALAAPRVLAPLNRLWMRFGGLLHSIVTPVILGFVFFTTVTPIALILRVLKKDVISLKFEPERESYWIDREPGAPEPETMKNQF